LSTRDDDSLNAHGLFQEILTEYSFWK